MNNITVVGMGYVGLSIAVLLAQNNNVKALDIVEQKIDKINNREPLFKDSYIENYFVSKKLHLTATLDNYNAYKQAQYIIICVPTNYDVNNNFFDTSKVEKVIKDILSINKKALIIIKSTIPVGYTKEIMNKYKVSNIIFYPEFLRETKALYDNLYPSRIVIGTSEESYSESKRFVNLITNSCIKKDMDIIYMSTDEAEAVKLFSNTYLAMRISYFNELDTYAKINKLNTKNIIKGVCTDSRIGDFYNNPSFGYGGYCLPKDTKQLLSNYKGIPQKIISAVVESNYVRMNFIASDIENEIRLNNKLGIDSNSIIGIYRLTMKANSDNIRQSSVCGILNKLLEKDIKIIIFEPLLQDGSYYENCKVINNIFEFKKMSKYIIANRRDNDLNDVMYKVYTRDLFERD